MKLYLGENVPGIFSCDVTLNLAVQ